MSAFPGVSSYQSSSLGSKFVVIGVVCCQEMRRYALFHKVLPVLTKYLKKEHFESVVSIFAAYSLLVEFAPPNSQNPNLLGSDFVLSTLLDRHLARDWSGRWGIR